jgi:quercetin dioxygenase-like cupin family protein
MRVSRRDLGLLLPALTAVGASGQSKILPSAAVRFEDLKVRDNGKSRVRAVVNGETHSGYAIEMHITELDPGASPHPPHRHVHEEVMCVQRGLLDATVNGKKSRLTAGSVFYIHSDDEHGVENPGPETVQYFVIALGGDKV